LHLSFCVHPLTSLHGAPKVKVPSQTPKGLVLD
jgi:hypothetical protein